MINRVSFDKWEGKESRCMYSYSIVSPMKLPLYTIEQHMFLL